MLDIFRQLCDLVAPPKEATLKIRNETSQSFLRKLNIQKVKEFIVLSRYEDLHIQAAISANKFQNNPHAATLLAALLTAWYSTLPAKPTIFVPIPLSTVRERERGYNQVTAVLKKANLPGGEINELLYRTRHTTPQTSLGRSERLHNLENAFALKRLDVDSVKRVILVDDVLTTGATLKAALKTLQNNLSSDIEIISVALAH